MALFFAENSWLTTWGVAVILFLTFFLGTRKIMDDTMDRNRGNNSCRMVVS